LKLRAMPKSSIQRYSSNAHEQRGGSKSIFLIGDERAFFSMAWMDKRESCNHRARSRMFAKDFGE